MPNDVRQSLMQHLRHMVEVLHRWRCRADVSGATGDMNNAVAVMAGNVGGSACKSIG